MKTKGLKTRENEKENDEHENLTEMEKREKKEK